MDFPPPSCEQGCGAPPEPDLERLDTTAAVDTPERVRFRFRLAGPGRRGIAWAIDGMIRMVILLGVALLVTPLFLLGELGGFGIGAILLVIFLLEWGYGAAFETLLSGRTPGKMLLSLRVVREDGAPGRFPDFLLRNLLRAADYLPAMFAIGLGVMLMDRKLRRIGDLVAGTVVVIEQRGAVLGDVHIEPPVTDEERQALPPRVDLTREEVGLIEDFLRRRPRLGAARSEQLAALFGPALAERAGITAPTWERVLTLAYARHTGKDR